MIGVIPEARVDRDGIYHTVSNLDVAQKTEVVDDSRGRIDGQKISVLIS